MHPVLLMLAVEDKERPETVNAQEIQVTQIEDQWSFQAGKAADCLGYAVLIRRVDLAIDAQNGGEAARINI
jgi:hypothetical protein